MKLFGPGGLFSRAKGRHAKASPPLPPPEPAPEPAADDQQQD
jgi:hypothetical protein